MKNLIFNLLIALFIISSCGGGGGSDRLTLDVSNFNSLSVNEDDTYVTVISAQTNQPTKSVLSK